MTDAQDRAITQFMIILHQNAMQRTKTCNEEDKAWLQLGYIGDVYAELLSELDLTDSQIQIVSRTCDNMIANIELIKNEN